MCLYVCLCVRPRPHAHTVTRTDPDVTCGSGRECCLVVHYWVDLQSVHGLRCCGNITRTRNVSEYMLVLTAYLVIIVRPHHSTTYVDAACCYRPSSVICRSVCHDHHPAETTELIEMQFGLYTHVGPRNHVLDLDGRSDPVQRSNIEGKKGDPL